MEPSAASKLEIIESHVVECCLCPRLVEWRETVGREKVRRFREDAYWARPVPAFGDPTARLLVIGLAPAAHGGNRTGRMFTGDRSGDWLFRALHKAGFASQPQSVNLHDGLTLHDCFISATLRCAPPGNEPLPEEMRNCRHYLSSEADVLWPRLRVVVVLGRIAFDWWMSYLARREVGIPVPRPRFAHGAELFLPSAPALLCSFHPSQQNTNTGKLTEPMFDAIWSRAASLIATS